MRARSCPIDFGDGVRVHDVTEIRLSDDAVLANERQSLHRKPPFRQAGRLAAHQPLKPIFHRLDLHRAARQRDLRSGMTIEIVRFQHAERRIHPAQTRVPLMERRGNRQGVAFRDLLLQRRQVRLVVDVGKRTLDVCRNRENTREKQRDNELFQFMPE